MRYLGTGAVTNNQGLMEPVKAALQYSMRALAADRGPYAICVNAAAPRLPATRGAQPPATPCMSTVATTSLANARP
jgi:enoyl-[acyl-carrier-protein] reductase (NADH)